MTTVNPADLTGGLPAEPFDVQDALPGLGDNWRTSA